MSQSESRRVAHCMYVEIEVKKKKKEEKKKKEIFILKVWFYGNSVKLRQSPTHVNMNPDTHAAHHWYNDPPPHQQLMIPVL